MYVSPWCEVLILRLGHRVVARSLLEMRETFSYLGKI
jgi:hypothetical protein